MLFHYGDEFRKERKLSYFEFKEEIAAFKVWKNIFEEKEEDKCFILSKYFSNLINF